MGSRLRRALIALAGLAAFAIIGVVLERETGLPFDTTFRVACAAMCIFFIFQLRSDYPAERWPRISLWIALMVNIGLFFTPLFNRSASRGELMLFALPDAVVVLVVRILTYPVSDVHQRAMRQQMIFGLVVALLFCGLILGLTMIEPGAAHN